MTPPPKTLVYLFGPPATGKSTTMDHLTAACTRTPQPDATVTHDALTTPGATHPTAAEIGRRRPIHSGTDALSMSIHPHACAALHPGKELARWPLLVAEGDRLATLGFLTSAHAAGYTVRPLLLFAPEPVCLTRYTERGTTQDPTWRRGRITKTTRLAAHLDASGIRVTELDATIPPPSLAEAARAAAPELEVLT